MCTIKSVSVIFNTGDNCSCSSNKVYFLDLEESKLPRKIKSVTKFIYISGFWVVKYYVSSDIEFTHELQDQTYYVPRLPKVFSIISPQDIHTS